MAIGIAAFLMASGIRSFLYWALYPLVQWRVWDISSPSELKYDFNINFFNVHITLKGSYMSGGGPVSTRKLYVHVSLIYLFVVIFLGNQGAIILPTIYSHCRLIKESSANNIAALTLVYKWNFTMLGYSNKGIVQWKHRILGNVSKPVRDQQIVYGHLLSYVYFSELLPWPHV